MRCLAPDASGPGKTCMWPVGKTTSSVAWLRAVRRISRHSCHTAAYSGKSRVAHLARSFGMEPRALHAAEDGAWLGHHGVFQLSRTAPHRVLSGRLMQPIMSFPSVRCDDSGAKCASGQRRHTCGPLHGAGDVGCMQGLGLTVLSLIDHAARAPDDACRHCGVLHVPPRLHWKPCIETRLFVPQ